MFFNVYFSAKIDVLYSHIELNFYNDKTKPCFLNRTMCINIYTCKFTRI